MTSKTTSKDNGFTSWEVGSRYQLVERLGKGSYGEVVKARDQSFHRTVAIKQMKHVFEDSTDAKRAYREIHILRHLKHPSVVALLDVMLSSIDNTYLLLHRPHWEAGLVPPPPRHLGNLYLVFEYMDSDLGKIMKSNQYLSEEHIQYLLYQIFDGLSYVHQTNVIHRDLKPANVLVNCADCTVKIADFGLSRVVGSDLIATHFDADQPSGDEPLPEDDHHSNLSSPQHQLLLPGTNQAPPPATGEERGPPPRVPSSTSVRPAFPGLPHALPAPLSLKRGLTKHVITRWYRAPEVILLQPYTAAVDLWSVGCIFAELLNLVRDNVSDYKRRRALFPGESCGELSADDLATLQRKRVALGQSSLPEQSASAQEEAEEEQQRLLQESFGNTRSQLNIIFDVIGTPREEDLRHITDHQTLHFLRNVPARSPKDMRTMYPAADALALDLLQRLLHFDPSRRITAAEALNHPYFDVLKTRDYIHAYRAQNHHIIDRSSSSSSSAATGTTTTSSSTSSTATGSMPSAVAMSRQTSDALSTEEWSLRPHPLNVDIEKVAESPENLKRNIVHEVFYYRRRDLDAAKNASKPTTSR